MSTFYTKWKASKKTIESPAITKWPLLYCTYFCNSQELSQ